LPASLVAYDLGMNLYATRRMSAFASAVLNFEDGDELIFFAFILHSIGAGNGANLISANLVMEYLGGAASVTTWE
jgi:hypothetical protein